MNVELSPSNSVMVGAAFSSSLMVPTAVAAPIVALVGLDNVTLNVSLFSWVTSPRTGTEKVLLVSPGLKVRVPLVAV